MEQEALSSPELVILQLDVDSKEQAINQLSGKLYEAGRITELEGFIQQVNARENQMATGLPGGVGIPHARSQYAPVTSIAVGITKYGKSLDFGAIDGKADVILLLATPHGSYSEHLSTLATLARSLSKDNFRESLRRANDPEVIAELINSSVDFADP